MRLYLKLVLAWALQPATAFAFQGGTRQAYHGKSGSLPLSTSTRLFDSSGDNNDGDNESAKYSNDLDIFGQPKDTQQRKNKNAFFLDDDEAEVRGPERIKSCIPYILPLIDGDNFGKYIYERIPPLGTLDYILLRPFVEAIQAAPILSIILFIIFALGPQLTGQSREVRFNAQQAVLIDVALIIPQLLGDAVADADANFPRALMEPSSNFVWYFIVSSVVYCVLSNARGKIPNQIPFISAASDMAIGPF